MIRAIVCAALVLLLGRPIGGAAEEIGPEAAWCGAIHALAPGDELVLRPGEYQGSCTIRRGGAPGAPLIIRAKDPEDPPRIIYLEQRANVLNIYADHVIIRGLQFGPTLRSVDAIRIYTGNDVTVEECRFVEVGGIAVVANHASVRKVTVRRNEIVRSKATALYFGCHDGFGCTASELLIEQNYIHDVRAPDPEIGYGMEIKLGSTAIIRDNVVVNTKGPGIMVYGARELGRESIVERNFVAGSRNSSAIVVGGGPAIVRNNVAVTSAEAGIALENYGKRGLLRGIVVAHNTVYGNDKAGILVPDEGRLEAAIVNNAAHARSGTPVFPTGRVGVLQLGNVDCTWVVCFVDPDKRNFSPLVVGAGSFLGGPWIPQDDYFGRRRGVPPTVGAIEQPGGPIPLGMKVVSPRP